MSNQNLPQEIETYVDSTPFGILAYVRADQTPVQRTFGAFARVGSAIVVATGRQSAKVAELKRHPRVSFFVEKSGQEGPKWKSALFIGDATEVTCEKKRAAALDAVSARNAYIRNRVAQDGGADFILFRIETREVEWLDRTKGPGHVDRIAIAEGVPA
jgi:pyridoxamine 5'-phosphate oxidase